MFMLSGCGTTLYGRAKTPDDRGRIATKWFCLFYVPIIPLKSYRVLETTEGPNLLVWQNTSYQLEPLPQLYRPHLKVWAMSWGIFIASMYILAKLTEERP